MLNWISKAARKIRTRSPDVKSIAKLRRGLDTAAKIVAILGLFGFIWQQYDAAEGRRIDRTFDFVKQFQSKETTEARYELASVWDRYAVMIGKAVDQGLSANDKDKLVRAIVANSPSLLVAIYRTNDFFEALQLCVSSGGCEGEIVRTFFGDYVVRFFCLYDVILKDRRTALRIPEYGEGISKLAMTIGKC